MSATTTYRWKPKSTSADVEFVSNVYMVDGMKVIQCNIPDITERKEIEERTRRVTENLLSSLREQANHDQLTGLFNRRYLTTVCRGN